MLQVTMFVITIYDVYPIITAYSSLFNWNMLSTPCLKKLCKFVFFLSELRQISINFDNFWQKHGKEDKIMWGALISTSFASPYTKRSCSKLLFKNLKISDNSAFLDRSGNSCIFVGESLPLHNKWRRWTQATSDQWVQGAVWSVDHWYRYQPVASSSKRLCPCTKGTLRA